MNRQLTAIISKEDDMYVALYPQVDIVSQGYSIPESISNLSEALTLYIECIDSQQIELLLAQL